MKTSISFLKHNQELEETITLLSNTDTDLLHVDIMDGKFVPNYSFDKEEIVSLFNKNRIKPLDIHLMVNEPVEYIEAFKNLNVEYITIHEEIEKDKKSIIDLIHSYNIKAGIAINPETSVDGIKYILKDIDYIIIMGVNPGLGGQKLIPETIAKIDELRNIREQYGYKYLISLDGGVNLETKPLLENLDIIISGSYVCTSDNFQEKINTLR